MIELKIVAGPDSGRRFVFDSLPLRVGRSKEMDLVVAGPGVWDHHLDLQGTSQGRIGIRSQGGASVLVDGEAVTDGPLRNGAVIDLAGARIRFAISPGEQRSLVGRERLFWLAAAVLVGVQVTLLVATGLRS